MHEIIFTEIKLGLKNELKFFETIKYKGYSWKLVDIYKLCLNESSRYIKKYLIKCWSDLIMITNI